MIYQIRRFSFEETLKDGNEYISAQVDSGLGKVEDISTKILEDPKLGQLRPVKRHVGLVKNLSKLLRPGKKKDKKKKSKKYSESDPTTTLNTSEANKFKNALGRLANTMGSSDSQSLLK